jgi:hypothetical protein
MVVDPIVGRGQRVRLRRSGQRIAMNVSVRDDPSAEVGNVVVTRRRLIPGVLVDGRRPVDRHAAQPQAQQQRDIQPVRNTHKNMMLRDNRDRLRRGGYRVCDRHNVMLLFADDWRFWLLERMRRLKSSITIRVSRFPNLAYRLLYKFR